MTQDGCFNRSRLRLFVPLVVSMPIVAGAARTCNLPAFTPGIKVVPTMQQSTPPSGPSPAKVARFLGGMVVPFLGVLAPGAPPSRAEVPSPLVRLMERPISGSVLLAEDLVIQEGQEEEARQRGKIMMEAQRDAMPGREGRLMGLIQPVDNLGQESEAIFKRARIAESDGDFEKALRLYDRVTRMSPGYAYAWSNKGNAHVALGELDQALDSYTRATELIPGRAGDSWLVWLNKATTELALGRTDECLVDLDKARLLRGQPDVLLFANKGIALERKGDFVQALENYENAYLTRPKDVSPWWLRYSLCLYQENQDIKAMEIMRKVSAKFPKENEVNAALSTLVYAFGDQDEAGRLLQGLTDPNYKQKSFLVDRLHWPPRAVDAILKLAALPPKK